LGGEIEMVDRRLFRFEPSRYHRRSSVRALLCLNDASSSSSSPKWAAPAAFGGTKPARAYAMPRALAHAATKRDLVAKE
jgi:hypothetical protein